MRAYLLLGVAALSLGACKLDREPTAADQAELTAGAPFDLLLAPAYADLPPAQPVPVLYAPQPVAYDYWNDAYDMNQAYYNQPPAYFNYAGATPLVWGQPQQQQSLGDTLTNVVITRIVEALVGGGQREYFYQPGNEQPFFVRDPQYAYAVDDGRLVAVYDPYGRTLGEQLLMQQAPVVGRYMLRADSLRDAALVAALQPLAPQVWTTQRAVWIDQLDDNDGWRSTWIPGANRSPVAIQRLAEVRARKEARDEAHAAWKRELAANRPNGKGPKLAKVDRDNDRGAIKSDNRGGPKADKNDNAKGPKRDNDNNSAKADKRADNGSKAVKTAEVSKGAKKADAKGGKDKGDRGGNDGGDKGNGKKG